MLIITSVWFNRRGKTKQVSVSYKVMSHGVFRSPRSSTSWLDDKDDLFIEKELDGWKARVNQDSGSSSEFFPDFFLRQRPDYIRWCSKSAKAVSIEGYLFYLGRFVFPFFIQRLREQDPTRWRASYTEWEAYLTSALDSLDSRNKARTALRRYLKFLEAKGKTKEVLLLPRNETARRKQREGDVLPGELPDWADASAWLRSLPAGRPRWVLAICAAFGVRISEALTVRPEHLIGHADVSNAQLGNGIIQKVFETGQMVAFLNVDEAQKRAIKDSHVLKAMGDVDDEPKTGPYTAGCNSQELGQLVLEMCESGEHAGETDHNEVYKFIKAQNNLDASYPFSEYSPHDFRRLHITLQALDLQSFFMVAQLHGHSSEDTTKRYYQWGHMKRRRKSGSAFQLISKKTAPSTNQTP